MRPNQSRRPAHYLREFIQHATGETCNRNEGERTGREGREGGASCSGSGRRRKCQRPITRQVRRRTSAVGGRPIDTCRNTCCVFFRFHTPKEHESFCTGLKVSHGLQLQSRWIIPTAPRCKLTRFCTGFKGGDDRAQAAAAGESWLTTAIPMDNPYCSRNLTRGRSRCSTSSTGPSGYGRRRKPSSVRTPPTDTPVFVAALPLDFPRCCVLAGERSRLRLIACARPQTSGT